MINANIVREVENDSRIQNINKQTPAERRLCRMKASALSDVQNTLHSRPVQFGNPTNSGIKAPIKSPALTSNFSQKKKTISRTRLSNTKKELHSNPNVHSDCIEYHNHILCEQAEQFSMDDFLFSYKLSDAQINALTKSVKSFKAPLTYKEPEPCEDLKIPIRKSEDVFSVSDIFSDMMPIEIEAPSW